MESEDIGTHLTVWRWRLWLKIDVVLSAIILALFFLRLHIEGLAHYSIFLFPLFVLLIGLIFPWFAWKIRNPRPSIILTLILGLAIIALRFSVNGGSESGTAFWLATAPLLFLILLGAQEGLRWSIGSFSLVIFLVLWMPSTIANESSALRIIVILTGAAIYWGATDQLERQRVQTQSAVNALVEKIRLAQTTRAEIASAKVEKALFVGLSHEINNPLTIAIVSLRLLQRKAKVPLPEDELKMLISELDSINKDLISIRDANKGEV